MNILIPVVVVALAVRLAVYRNLDVMIFRNWKKPWLIWAAVVVQLSPAFTPDWMRWPSTAISLALGFAFLVANGALRNLALAVFLVGLAANVTVMIANHGMPVSRDGLAKSGWGAEHNVRRGHFLRHVPMDENTKLAFLGDRVPILPLRSVASIGDFIMLGGLGVFLVKAMPRPRVVAVPA